MSSAPLEKPDGFKEFIFFALIVIVLVVGMWFALRKPLMWLSFYSSYYAFRFYEFFPLVMSTAEYQALVTARKAIPSLNPTQFGLSALYQLFEYHGYFWRWIVVPVLLWWGWRTKKSVVRFRFNREIKDVYDLIEIQAKHFPASAIIRGKNLLATHPYVGPWATYALPLDFTLDNRLLWVSKEAVTSERKVDETSMVPIPALTPTQKLQPFPVKRKMLPSHRYVLFNVDRANTAFSNQLGPLWNGAQALPPLERALYAAFCAQACGDQGAAWTMVAQLGFSFREGERDKQGKLLTPHHANTNGTDELLAKFGNQPAIRQIHELHAHAINVITATLALCRKKGRLTHANFLWLKPVNRTLWYALCGQGGQSAYWEAAGPWAHALIEELMGKRVTVPMVAGAVDALRDTMSREHWIDPEEYSEEAQQRLVRAANQELEDGIERTKKGGNPMLGGLGGFQQPAHAAKKRKKEDDEP